MLLIVVLCCLYFYLARAREVENYIVYWLLRKLYQGCESTNSFGTFASLCIYYALSFNIRLTMRIYDE